MPPTTQIIATLGPSSNSYTVLRKMVRHGMDVVRFNFSHGSHGEHAARLEQIRRINRTYRRHIRIMQDLEGFRIRVGRFAHVPSKVLQERSMVILTTGPDDGGPRTIPVDYDGDLSAAPEGRMIYMDDGNIILAARRCTRDRIEARVIEGGELLERKGVNIPDMPIAFSGMTDKDRRDLVFAVEHGVDYIAQSFVRTAGDVRTLRAALGEAGAAIGIVAKIECREAIENVDAIIDEADGIMVARGDMGIALPIEEIPVTQKRIIRKCNDRGRFVITATQMLEHMTRHRRPTRAEVTDVANAILDGTDYVMLSGETAVGKYPVEAVRVMNEIIKVTENYRRDRGASTAREASS